MKRLAIHILLLLLFTCLTGTAWSKGAVTRIVIEAGPGSEQVEITNKEILEKFTIWSGPGVGGWDIVNTIPPPGTPKFIVDWTIPFQEDESTGKEGRANQINCLVTFYIEGRKPPKDTYEVLYAIAKGVHRGLVYLPSYPNDDFGKWNTFQIYRGVEGRWFYATKEWDELVRPLMGKE